MLFSFCIFLELLCVIATAAKSLLLSIRDRRSGYFYVHLKICALWTDKTKKYIKLGLDMFENGLFHKRDNTFI